MTLEILMPAISPTMTKGNIVRWIKNEGDALKAGDAIAEVECDGAVVKIGIASNGTLEKILAIEGTMNIPVNTPIASMIEEGAVKSAVAGDGPSTDDHYPSYEQSFDLKRIGNLFKFNENETLFARLQRIGPGLHALLTNAGRLEAGETVDNLMKDALSLNLAARELVGYINIAALFAGENGALPSIPVQPGLSLKRFGTWLQDYAPPHNVVSALLPHVDKQVRQFQAFLIMLDNVEPVGKQDGKDNDDADVLVNLWHSRQKFIEAMQNGDQDPELPTYIERVDTMLKEAFQNLTADPETYRLMIINLQNKKMALRQRTPLPAQMGPTLGPGTGPDAERTGSA